ncbi:LysM peptidoglycan-binding domain-containing protein [Georgenia sp. 311]|uniref:LysM peptidoglycan-binding domain-containing protein n=2 Tax=Bogoriellaceae TaxID=145358 RepID=A0ABX5VTN6_9MICO|nr:LysM peptidoglycan-binding domain-containing protein [Georgenia wutianyii]TNC21051.1 LysM peptidoglycan-binding domain-containing protein [Georgenia sp. 311]
MMATEKAFLELEGGERLPCLFNPAQLAISRSNDWTGEALPGRGVPRLRYAGAQPGWMHLELFFDTTHDGSAVTRYTGRILALMDVDPTLPGSDETTSNARPPYVTFHWGDLHSFKAVVADLSMAFTYFASNGTPLRATVALTLRQYEPSQAFGPQNPTSGTPDPHRTHRVRPGETLDRIAATYYGDATSWRRLALANGVQDPLALRAGTVLSIPRADA